MFTESGSQRTGGAPGRKAGPWSVLGYGVWAMALLWFGVEVVSSPVLAQASRQPVLTAPIAATPGGPGADGQLTAGALTPIGQWKGQPSPNSTLAPLAPRSDVMTSSSLS